MRVILIIDCKTEYFLLRNGYFKSSERAIFIKAYERSPVRDIYIKDCNFSGVEKENIINFVENLQLENVYLNGEPWENQ